MYLTKEQFELVQRIFQAHCYDSNSNANAWKAVEIKNRRLSVKL